MTAVTYTIEMGLGEALQDCAGAALLDCNGLQLLAPAWVDVTSDVRTTASIQASGGMMGSTITDRVAPPGMLSFDMDNSEGNSAATVGYYSPDHASCRDGFDVGTRTRFKLASGGTTLYPFYGRIKKIKVQPGPKRERTTQVTCADFMEQTSIHKINLIPVQLSKRNDQLLTTILANMPIQPLNTSFATGPDTFPTALNAEEDEKTFANTVMQKCAQSDLGYIYVRGNATDGETFVYESRQTRSLNVTPKVTLNDTMISMSPDRNADNIWNTVKVTAYPDKYDASVVVLYSSAAEIPINAGQTHTFTARFRDPAGLSQRTSLYPGSEVTPVAVTDYKFSSVSGNNGYDLNANLSISVTWGGNSAEVTLTNNGVATGYLQIGFQLRGKGIYHYDPLEVERSDAASRLTHGDKALSFSLPYQSSHNVANDFAQVLLARSRHPVTNISEVTFIANRNATLMEAALTCVIGDRITLIETVTGLSADYNINGTKYEIQAGGILKVSWLLESAGAVGGWILDSATLSLLDSTTILGF